MVSSPITSWQIDGETVETITDFIFLGSKITADSDCSHEIKRCLLLERKSVTTLDSILKSRDVTLPTEVHIVKAVVFRVVMYGCASQTIRKAECRRIWCFWTVVLEKTLESPLDCKEIQLVHPKGNESWAFIGRTDVEAEAPVNFGHLMQRTDSLEKTWCWERVKVGGEGDDGGWDGWMASPIQKIWVWASSGSWWLTRRPGILQFMGLQRIGYNWATELKGKWL